MQLNFFDTSSDNNGNALVSQITLNKDSAFFQYTNIAETEYQYVITARFLDWFKLIDGKSYRAVLSYYDDNNQYESITYNWTMSIDSSQQQVIADTTQQDINSGINNLNNSINDTNNFLQDTNFDSQLVDMPSYTVSENISQFIDTFFTALYDAFTSNNPIDFVFTIPNSNGQTITIPSNYIESHLPNAIILIIRAFYWYMISRYIFLDIMKIINKIRQGDYFMSSDSNIKTEVL